MMVEELLSQSLPVPCAVKVKRCSTCQGHRIGYNTHCNSGTCVSDLASRVKHKLCLEMAYLGSLCHYAWIPPFSKSELYFVNKSRHNQNAHRKTSGDFGVEGESEEGVGQSCDWDGRRMDECLLSVGRRQRIIDNLTQQLLKSRILIYDCNRNMISDGNTDNFPAETSEELTLTSPVELSCQPEDGISEDLEHAGEWCGARDEDLMELGLMTIERNGRPVKPSRLVSNPWFDHNMPRLIPPSNHLAANPPKPVISPPPDFSRQLNWHLDPALPARPDLLPPRLASAAAELLNSGEEGKKMMKELTQIERKVSALRENEDSSETSSSSIMRNNFANLDRSQGKIPPINGRRSNAIERRTGTMESEHGNESTLRSNLGTMRINEGPVRSNYDSMRTNEDTMRRTVDSTWSNGDYPMRSNTDSMRSNAEHSVRSNVDSMRSNVDSMRSNVDSMRSNVDSMRSNADSMQNGGQRRRAIPPSVPPKCSAFRSLGASSSCEPCEAGTWHFHT